MSSRKKLENITSKDIDHFTLDGKKGLAKVVSIHDGDTCDVVFKLHGKYKERFNCRLLSYDAPELKEGTNAKLARDYLAHLVMDGRPGGPSYFDPKIIWKKQQLQERLDNNKDLTYAEFRKFDGFGRALVTLKRNYDDDESINDMMKKYIKELQKRKRKTRKQKWNYSIL